MSGTRRVPVPAGLDELDSEDEAALAEMRSAGDGDPSVDVEQAPQAAPVAEPVEETPEAVEQPEPSQPIEPKMVPLRTLTDERNQRKAAERAAAEAREETAAARAKFEERLRLIAEATEASIKASQPPKPEETIPDLATDPVGHLTATNAKLAREVEELRAIATGVNQNQQQAASARQLTEWARAQENAFAATPEGADYAQAVQFLKESRTRELTAFGYTDPAMLEQQVNADIGGIAVAAFQQKGDFARRLYAGAVARGYQKPAPVARATPTDPATLPPLVPEARPTTVPANLLRRENGRANATTIGAAGGSPPARTLTPGQIADMDDVAFDRYVSGLSNGRLRELMGD